MIFDITIVTIDPLVKLSRGIILLSTFKSEIPMVQYAKVETKSAPLAGDFAREFMTKRWGAEFTEAVLAAMPRYVRGPKAGQIKGSLMWTKVIEGGWYRSDWYTGVLKPGSKWLRVSICRECLPNDGLRLPATPLQGEELTAWIAEWVTALVKTDAASWGR